MLAFKPERRPQADIWGARGWVSAEHGGMRGSGCAVPPPRVNTHPSGLFLANPTRVLQRENEPPSKEKEPPPQHLHKAFLGGWKKKTNVFLPLNLFQQMRRVGRSRVALFGGWICLDPRFWGAFRSSLLFCWMLAASEG